MIAWILVAVVGALAVVAAWGWFRAERRVKAGLEEAERLRNMVKERVERPNVFSHEVRTPLTLIRGAAELLAEETPGPLTERQREFVHTISSNAQQVIALAENLLTEAKIDSQLFDLHLEHIDLRPLVRQAVREARRIHLADIRFDEHNRPLLVLGDSGLLVQALRNLVTNACTHSGEHAIVRVATTESEGRAIITVSDMCDGMTQGQRESLFDPFVVGESSRAGTGLGMMITQRIVAQHNGNLAVDTVPGHGTTILLTIPTNRE